MPRERGAYFAMSELVKSRRSFVGIVLAIAAIACALVGPFVSDGISLELLGLVLGALGYSFALHRDDRFGQGLGIAAILLCFIAIFINGLIAPPQ
jgi:hypothetical protein